MDMMVVEARDQGPTGAVHDIVPRLGGHGRVDLGDTRAFDPDVDDPTSGDLSPPEKGLHHGDRRTLGRATGWHPVAVSTHHWSPRRSVR
jgi:hypothetical protein